MIKSGWTRQKTGNDLRLLEHNTNSSLVEKPEWKDYVGDQALNKADIEAKVKGLRKCPQSATVCRVLSDIAPGFLIPKSFRETCKTSSNAPVHVRFLGI